VPQRERGSRRGSDPWRATEQPSEQAGQARALVAGSESPVVISDLVVGETYFALRHHYGVPHGEVVSVLADLLADPRIRPSGIARRVLADPAVRSRSKSAPALVDRLIHAGYAADDAPLVTFDRALSRLSDARLLG